MYSTPLALAAALILCLAAPSARAELPVSTPTPPPEPTPSPTATWTCAPCLTDVEIFGAHIIDNLGDCSDVDGFADAGERVGIRVTGWSMDSCCWTPGVRTFDSDTNCPYLAFVEGYEESEPDDFAFSYVFVYEVSSNAPCLEQAEVTITVTADDGFWMDTDVEPLALYLEVDQGEAGLECDDTPCEGTPTPAPSPEPTLIPTPPDTPPPTLPPTPESSATPTASPTLPLTSTPTPPATATPTPRPTGTPTSEPTGTFEPTVTPTPKPTSTCLPCLTDIEIFAVTVIDDLGTCGDGDNLADAGEVIGLRMTGQSSDSCCWTPGVRTVNCSTGSPYLRLIEIIAESPPESFGFSYLFVYDVAGTAPCRTEAVVTLTAAADDGFWRDEEQTDVHLILEVNRDGSDYVCDETDCEGIGVSLEMNQELFEAGDQFHLGLSLWNRDDSACALPLFLVLEAAGSYWFWPAWSPAPDYVEVPLPHGGDHRDAPVLDFIWPDNAGALAGLRFWTALTSPDLTQIIGTMDMQEWGASG